MMTPQFVARLYVESLYRVTPKSRRDVPPLSVRMFVHMDDSLSMQQYISDGFLTWWS